MAIILGIQKAVTRFKEWHCLALSPKIKQDIYKDLNHQPDKVAPIEFVKIVMKHTCFSEKDLVNEKYFPIGKSSITPDEIEKFSPEDIEQFATIFIDSNEGLFRENIVKNERRDDGELTLSFDLGKVVHPRNKNESSIDYFYRLYKTQIKEYQMKPLRIKDILAATTPSFKDLSQSLQSSLATGNSLKEKLESIVPETNRRQQDHPMSGEALRAISEEYKSRFRPYNIMYNKFDQIIEVSNNIANYTLELNEIQVKIAQELKISGDRATKIARWDLAVSIIIVILTMILLIPQFTRQTTHNNPRQTPTTHVGQQDQYLSDKDSSLISMPQEEKILSSKPDFHGNSDENHSINSTQTTQKEKNKNNTEPTPLN